TILDVMVSISIYSILDESLFVVREENHEIYREIYGDPIYDIYEDDVLHIDFIFKEGSIEISRAKLGQNRIGEDFLQILNYLSVYDIYYEDNINFINDQLSRDVAVNQSQSMISREDVHVCSHSKPIEEGVFVRSMDISGVLSLYHNEYMKIKFQILVMCFATVDVKIKLMVQIEGLLRDQAFRYKGEFVKLICTLSAAVAWDSDMAQGHSARIPQFFMARLIHRYTKVNIDEDESPFVVREENHEIYREIYGDPIYDIYEDDVLHTDFIFKEGSIEILRAKLGQNRIGEDFLQNLNNLS
ncbi:hypothetical protein HID58_032986, partial [Brassica napus]